MKRAHRTDGGGAGGGERLEGKSKCKTMAVVEEEVEQDAGVDELLAALGYKVRSSDMADVAQKLEQLEMVMAIGSDAAAVAAGPGFGSRDDAVPEDNAVLSHLASETVHYNPSDLSSWLESMLSEFNPPSAPPALLAPAHPPPPVPAPPPLLVEESSSITTVDLPSPPPKRLKISPTSQDSTAATAVDVPPESSLPIVMVDSQETGIRLVHTLLGCAQAVQDRNHKAAEALVKQIGILSLSQGGSMRKVATYFAEALARRIYNLRPTNDLALESAFSDLLQSHFYETCPYLKFAHFTANQAILEAFAGKARVHVVDFGMKQGMQWPALMQALALRPGGPPFFRLTGIGPPQPDNTDALQQVGWRLAQLAETIHIEFEYRGFVANSLADLEPYMLELGLDEAVAINSMFELHKLLNRPAAMEKVFRTIKALKPSIVTVVEEEANHNGPVFLDRFTEALHYYSSMFDSVEGCGGGSSGGEEAEDRLMTELYLGRQICNVVACEGEERVERHETMGQWKRRMADAGFEPAHLGSNAFKQASMLLALFAGGDGYRVEEKDGCLMLGWHTRPLITTSAWRIPSSTAAGAGSCLRSPPVVLDPSDL